MKKPAKVLQLHRETVQALDSSEFRKVLGAGIPSVMTNLQSCCDSASCRPCMTE